MCHLCYKQTNSFECCVIHIYLIILRKLKKWSNCQIINKPRLLGRPCNPRYWGNGSLAAKFIVSILLLCSIFNSIVHMTMEDLPSMYDSLKHDGWKGSIKRYFVHTSSKFLHLKYQNQSTSCIKMGSPMKMHWLHSLMELDAASSWINQFTRCWENFKATNF